MGHPIHPRRLLRADGYSGAGTPMAGPERDRILSGLSPLVIRLLHDKRQVREQPTQQRRCGTGPRGERAYGKVPHNRGRNTTLIASLTFSGMGESVTIEGATDA